jgi:glycosyltransferase involved in cell wall biosynthesis
MLNLLWTTFVFPFVALKERADVALIPNFTLLLFKFRPTVIILHDLIEFNVPGKFSPKKMFYRTKIADPVSARTADHIITVSKNSGEDIVRFLGIRPSKISVVYNGVDRERFYPMDETRRQAILSGRGWPLRFMLYAGTIDHPGKNAMNLIKAFERMKDSGAYDGSLILAGMYGSGHEAIEEHIARSAHRDDIIVTGYVSDEELVALYSQCEVFGFLSLYEGFGIPPLDAMACGAKVVVSNRSSLPEVVGDAGWQANPESVEDIAGKLLEALTLQADPPFRAKAEVQLAKFNWSVQGARFEEKLIEAART